MLKDKNDDNKDLKEDHSENKDHAFKGGDDAAAELAEVKVVDGGKKEPDSESNKSEKKDPEKPERAKSPNPKKICAVKAQCVQQFQELDKKKKFGLCAIILGLILLILIIILIAACTQSGWANEARIVDGGKFIETHTVCGPVQG